MELALRPWTGLTFRPPIVSEQQLGEVVGVFSRAIAASLAFSLTQAPRGTTAGIVAGKGNTERDARHQRQFRDERQGVFLIRSSTDVAS